MTSHAFTVATFVKEMNDVDPDHRCTALFFLIRELEQSLVLMDITKLAIAQSAEEEDLSGYAVAVTMYQFKHPSN